MTQEFSDVKICKKLRNDENQGKGKLLLSDNFFFSTDNSVDVPVTDIAMVYFIDTDLRILWRN